MIDSLVYLKRYALWNSPTIRDFRKFTNGVVETGNPGFRFKKDESGDFLSFPLFTNTEYRYRKERLNSSLRQLMVSTGTTSFIVIKDDTILFEEYFNGYARESVNTSFSVAKSVTSALIGIAAGEGNIGGMGDRVIDYIPELKGRVSEALSIQHLIMMSSGIRYNPSHYPWADEPKSYYYPDIRKLVLSKVVQEDEPGRYFKYVNYNTILLGIILERSTGMMPNDYLQEKIWKPLGMEYPASWNLDSKNAGFPKMESGINGRSIDFARFGRLFVNKGRWDDRQLISEKWVEESTSPLQIPDDQYYKSKNYYPYSMFFKDPDLYYKYGWWGIRDDSGSYDYTAIGVLGQFIFISPQKKMIIVRNGKRWGKISWWPGLFKRIVDRTG